MNAAMGRAVGTYAAQSRGPIVQNPTAAAPLAHGACGGSRAQSRATPATAPAMPPRAHPSLPARASSAPRARYITSSYRG
jgi:hypothetical protein